MNSDQKLKEANLRTIADRALAGEVANHHARDILLNQIKKTPAGRAYIFGTAPTPSAQELEHEIWLTSAGQDMKQMLEDSKAQVTDEEADKAAELERINALPPAERMNAARKAGLV